MLGLGVMCHMMACLWVYVGRQGDKTGGRNWLRDAHLAGWHYKETKRGDQGDAQLPVASFQNPRRAAPPSTHQRSLIHVEWQATRLHCGAEPSLFSYYFYSVSFLFF